MFLTPYYSAQIVKYFFTVLVSSKQEQTASHIKKEQFSPVHISKRKRLS
jgi:hypothetical protein